MRLPAVVDHVLLGVSDLDRGIQWVEERTGVKPAVGGRHPGRGTRNALLSLGPTRYLEVIAPDPTQDNYTFQIDVRTLTEPRVITWAAATSDIDALARTVKASGRDVMGPFDGSRARPDGKLLKWRTLGVSSNFAVGVVDPIPFFIQWAPGTPHPAADSPRGCWLDAMRFAHPAATGVTGALKAIGIDADVSVSAEAAIFATLSTPKGIVELR
jgi:hypothetical protein